MSPRMTPMPAAGPAELENLERALLLEAIHRRYGYDLSGYEAEALTRPIQKLLREEQVASVTALTERLLRRPECMSRLLREISGRQPGPFHDPSFFLTLRTRVAPLLRTYPSIRVWVAGCGDGDEVRSLAILLQEERLGGRCDLFATDLDEETLARARAGWFPRSAVPRFERDYLRAGGTASFDDYYTAQGDVGLFRPELMSRVVFATHFPVTDEPFNEFHLILCRAPWPRFGRALQQRVCEIIHRSMALLGFVALGPGPGWAVSPYAHCYEEFSAEHRLHRRMR